MKPGTVIAGAVITYALIVVLANVLAEAGW